MKHRLGTVVMAGCVAAAGLGVLTTSSAQAAGCDASDAAIYTPPATAPGAPGTLISCEPVTLSQVPDNIAMKAWKVQYASTNTQGAPIAVSGTVAVPTAPWTGGGARPVVAFTPGTLGLGPQCAFSKQLAGAYTDEYEGNNIAAILQAGYAVAATDGVGYLNGQTHTYVVGRNAGHALLDIGRAAFEVPGAGLDPSAKVALWGYSEGGAASLWAAQLAASYAPELDVVGDASGGVPGDLRVTAASLNGSGFAGFLIDAVAGLSTAYPAMPFTALLNGSGMSAVATAKSECLIGTTASFAFADISNYTTGHLTLDQLYALRGTDGTTWGQVVDAQKLGAGIGLPASGAEYEIGFPVFQYHGVADEVIPTQTEDATATAYCAAHIPTRQSTYLGDHLLADGLAVSDVMSWLGDRFAGEPTAGNC